MSVPHDIVRLPVRMCVGVLLRGDNAPLGDTVRMASRYSEKQGCVVSISFCDIEERTLRISQLEGDHHDGGSRGDHQTGQLETAGFAVVLVKFGVI